MILVSKVVLNSAPQLIEFLSNLLNFSLKSLRTRGSYCEQCYSKTVDVRLEDVILIFSLLLIVILNDWIHKLRGACYSKLSDMKGSLLVISISFLH